MGMPQMKTPEEVLRDAKETLLKSQPNIEVIEQIQYMPKPTGLPSFKKLSFILYKSLDDNSLQVAQTENTTVTVLTKEEFKEAVSKFDTFEQRKLEPISKALEGVRKSPKLR